jgi:hypothetical protein
VRHLVLVDFFVGRVVPTTLPQIVPDHASGIDCQGTINSFVRPDYGEYHYVVVVDFEAGPARVRVVVVGSHPFLLHDASTHVMQVKSR